MVLVIEYYGISVATGPGQDKGELIRVANMSDAEKKSLVKAEKNKVPCSGDTVRR